MRAFLDFEASSLGKNGYPIEVAWVFEDGTSETHLIRPAPQWSDWDEQAEAVHGITRATLAAEGEPHDMVAKRMLQALSGHALYASAPSWDGKWLSTLLRAAGLPRHALRLKDSEEAQQELATAYLRPVLDAPTLAASTARIVEQVERSVDRRAVRHRALDDAEQERRKWLEAGRLAAAERDRVAGSLGRDAGRCA
jgi:hypothetical protein